MTQRNTIRHADLPLNLYEGDEQFIVLSSLPGVRPEDLEVRLEGDQLTVAATRHEPHPAAEGDAQARPLFRELGGVRYSRQLRLRGPIHAEAIEARLDQGLLRVTVPKAAAARPRTIEVRVG